MVWDLIRQHLVEPLRRGGCGLSAHRWQPTSVHLHNVAAHLVSHSERLIETKTGQALLSHGRILLALLRLIQGKIVARYETFIANASPGQKRAVAVTFVAAVHCFLVIFLVIGLHLRTYAKPSEVEMTLGGPNGVTSELPKFVTPKVPTVPPPFVETDDTFQANLVGPQGSPNVTSPAEAIATEHQFPSLPAGIADRSSRTVRLTLSITEEGAIADATVIQSSGVSDLDNLAIAWVRAHWRYRPAMKNGVAIAVTSTAVLVFSAV